MNLLRVRIISIISAALIIIGAGFFVLREKKSEPESGSSASYLNAITSVSQTEEQASPDSPPRILPGYKTYKNDNYGFFFQYPQDVSINEFGAEHKGNIILFQDKNHTGFQIYMTDVPAVPLSLTKELIKKELPDIVMEDVQDIILSDDIRAISFWSREQQIGKTHEVWMAHAGTLYQISSSTDFDQTFMQIMKTWRFME